MHHPSTHSHSQLPVLLPFPLIQSCFISAGRRNPHLQRCLGLWEACTILCFRKNRMENVLDEDPQIPLSFTRETSPVTQQLVQSVQSFRAPVPPRKLFFSPTIQEAVVTGLLPETTYSITVAAYTTKGDGARSKARTVTTTGAGLSSQAAPVLDTPESQLRARSAPRQQ